MSTQSKLDQYDQALKDWLWKMKAWRTEPMLASKPLEPSMEVYGLREDLEVWAAAKSRARIIASAGENDALVPSTH